MKNLNQTALTNSDIDELEFGYSHENKVEFIAIFNDDVDMKVEVEFDMDFDNEEGVLYYWENKITNIVSRDWASDTPEQTNSNSLEKVELVRELLKSDFIQNKWVDGLED